MDCQNLVSKTNHLAQNQVLGALFGSEKGGADPYRFGFNGQMKDNEMKGVGNSLDFGARMYDSRIGRWLTSDPKEIKYPSLSPYHFGFNNPIVTIDVDGNENVVVVGQQNDNSSANKLMFAHQAISKLNDYARYESEESKSLVVFTEGYSKKQLAVLV